MNLHQCLLTNNDCYKTNKTITPKGIMWHSTGANNPNIRRYVQPDDGLLGANSNGNHWNVSGLSVCVNAFIGKLKDGTIATYQTLPWNHKPWGAGVGTSGISANNTHIQFEICEDALSDETYFNAVYQEAVELTAYLCKMYGLDPTADGVIICHSEGHTRGIASGHADVMHWFPTFGKSMDTARADVAAAMSANTTTTTEDDEDMTQDKFNEMMDVYLTNLGTQEPSDWSATARGWAEGNGIIKGDESGQKLYKVFCTREQMVQFLYRFKNET